MSTLRVDNIKGRTGTTVNIPDSNNLSVSGSLNVTGVTTFSSGAQLNLQGVDLNSGSRGDVLVYDSNGKLSKLTIGAAGSVLKSDGNDLVFGGIGGATNVYYVSTNGSDAAGRGGSIDTAFRTLKYACSNIGTPTATAPAVIFVKSGTYEEGQLPIIVPPYCTIVGDNLRSTIIKPAGGLDSSGSILNNRSTLFRMSNGVIIQDLVLDGMGGYTPGNPNNDPTIATLGGVYFALNAQSPVTDKSPYIYNVTSFGDGATGAVVDGSLHSSGNRSMLFHTYTCIHSDGLGIWAKDNSNVECISGFTYYCTIGYSATGGSKFRSLNSSNSYGEYGVYSAGFDASETPNQGNVRGTMLAYTNVLTTQFTLGEELTAPSGATAYVANVQAEPKVIYIVGKSGSFAAGEVVTGSQSGATATLDSGTFETNQSGRILVTQFGTSADPGDSLQFATTDGNAYQIQSVSSVTANSIAYHVLVFSGSRATPIPDGTVVNVRKEFSLIRLTGHDFLQVGTGGTDTTRWPNNPSQTASQADQVVTNTTDPGRVYYVATDEMGNFYVGDQFKVDQATGNVTLDSSAFDLTGLQSLRLGAVGGLIGASVNEFSTDGTLSQNSDEKVPTQRAVKTYVDNLDSFAGDLTVGAGLTVSGDLHVGTGITMYASSGIVSATSFYGDGTNLTGVDATTIKDSGGSVRVQGNTSGIVVTGIATILGGLDVQEMFETVDVTSSAYTGTINHNLKDALVFYSTANATGNWTSNFRGDGSTTLNDTLKIGQSITVTILSQQGGTAYRNNGWQIDGSSVTPKWLGGVGAPTAGNANAIDYYTFTIIKTANATFTVLANSGPYV